MMLSNQEIEPSSSGPRHLSHLADLPFLGAGLGYRAELDSQIVSARASIDWLEVISEQYFVTGTPRRARLDELRQLFPVIPHGVEMSIGTPGDLDPEYRALVSELVTSISAPWFSDHLCFTRAGEVALGSLSPLHRTRSSARAIARKAQSIQDQVGVPFLLENITYYLDMQGELSETDFLCEVMDHCQCGMLLDLTNLHINSVNHGFDAIQWLCAVPLERVVQVHLAGGHRQRRLFVDTHAASVHEEVWALLERAMGRMVHLKAVLIERDENYPDDFGELTSELERARGILAAVRARGSCP